MLAPGALARAAGPARSAGAVAVDRPEGGAGEGDEEQRADRVHDSPVVVSTVTEDPVRRTGRAQCPTLPAASTKSSIERSRTFAANAA